MDASGLDTAQGWGMIASLDRRTFVRSALLVGAAATLPCIGKRTHAGASSPWGVYQGAGCEGAKRLAEFEQWLGYRPERGLDFFAWEELDGGWNWVMRCWVQAGMKDMTFSVPMLPSDGSATLAQGAQGQCDSFFARLGAALVKHGFARSVLRLGWEFNGDWYKWAARKDPSAWIAYWRRIVSILRQVPGNAFTIDWCPASSWTTLLAQDAYPGDEFVDIIGLDVYNATWDASVVTAEQRWNERMNGRHGLKWHRDFAALHGKPLSFPEWATGTRSDGHGAGDDPYFITQMAAWIAANDVAYHNYWEYRAKAYDGKLSDGRQPAAAAAFLRAFGRPAAPRLQEPR